MTGAAQSFRTDIRESGQAYLIEAELPGFKKEEIDIDYTRPYLTIKAVRKEENAQENEEHQVVRRERRYGSMCAASMCRILPKMKSGLP